MSVPPTPPRDGATHSAPAPAAAPVAAPAAAPAAAPVAAPSASALALMHPACFSLVMATGILSIGCELLGMRTLAVGLLGLNVLLYAVLCVLLVCRVVRYPRRVFADLSHHGRAFGFFTTVAATCVLGSQFRVVVPVAAVAVGLWCVGIVLWAVLTYGIFGLLTVSTIKPTLDAGINGGWLTMVVAAQSVSVLGTQLAAELGEFQPHALLFALVLWLGGGMIYVWIISLIFYRYLFFILSPSDLAPPYWINMGAMAISTLAGTMLIAAAPSSPLLADLLPFLKGLTLLFWSTATWWIPMLVILGFWRHVVRRFPLRYDLLYWGAVFPLGMYTVCTLRLSQVVAAPFLRTIPECFIYVALAAWTITFAGMLHSLWRMLGAARTR